MSIRRVQACALTAAIRQLLHTLTVGRDMTLPKDDGSDGRDRGRPTVVAVITAAVAVVFVIGYASRPQTVATSDTQPLVVEEPDPVVTTSSPVVTATTADTGPIEASPLSTNLPHVDDFPPVANRMLLTVTAGAGGVSHLISWPSDSPTSRSEIPPGAGPVLFLDASDTAMAFLGSPIRRVGLPLYAGEPGTWSPVASRVTSFSWHATWPLRLAWVETGRGLCAADFDASSGGLQSSRCLPGITGRLTGFDDHGFVLVEDGGVVRLTIDGEEVNRVPGTDALIGPDGEVLIEEISNPGGFAVVQADLTGRQHLEWTEGVDHDLVAWSPQATDELRADDRRQYPQIALLDQTTPDSYLLVSRDLDGNQLADIEVTGSFRDLQWDRSGRYLLAPGSHGEDNIVLVYDLAGDGPNIISFDEDVLESRLVIPTVCENASFLKRDWELRYDGPFEDLWIVSSRDWHLGWTFLSGRISDGPNTGKIPTWVLPWFGGGQAFPAQSVPANAVAESLGTGSPLDLAFFGIDDPMLIDGAQASQWCVATGGG